MNKPLGKLFDIMPKELLNNKHIILPGSDNNQIKNFLDNEQITEKAQVDKSDIILLKRSLRRPKRHVFIKEKENNGMVEKFTELSVWRENLLIKHKNEPKNTNAIELIIHELQTRLKDNKNITSQVITNHMNKHYKHLTAFSGLPGQRLKYCVQILSKINIALGPEKMVVIGETDNPLISTDRTGKKIPFSYNLHPEFFRHSAPALRKVVSLRYKLQIDNRKALNRAAKTNVKAAAPIQAPKNEKIETIPEKTAAKKIETIPEKTAPAQKMAVIEKVVPLDDTTKQIKSIPAAPPLVPTLQEITNGSLVVNYVLSKLDINSLINKVVDNGGAVKINSDSFEINMTGGN